MKVVNGTSYHDVTPDDLIEVLEESRRNKTRLKLAYGDPTTGRSWEDNPVACHIGRSTGNMKVPLEIKTTRSIGGGAVMVLNITKISHANKRKGGVIWKCQALRDGLGSKGSGARDKPMVAEKTKKK